MANEHLKSCLMTIVSNKYKYNNKTFLTHQIKKYIFFGNDISHYWEE